jgi:hypothetical protein
LVFFETAYGQIWLFFDLATLQLDQASTHGRVFFLSFLMFTPN